MSGLPSSTEAKVTSFVSSLLLLPLCQIWSPMASGQQHIEFSWIAKHQPRYSYRARLPVSASVFDFKKHIAKQELSAFENCEEEDIIAWKVRQRQRRFSLSTRADFKIPSSIQPKSNTYDATHRGSDSQCVSFS